MKFMKLFILGAIIAAFGLCSAVTAAPVVIGEIADNYVGADDHGWGDVIGNIDWFGVGKMVVSFDAVTNELIVDIYTNYLDNIGKYETKLGDLFISTDEWNPFGSSPYLNDDASNGEDWEYALVVDDHTGATTSGDAYLYSVNPLNINLSYAPAGYIWRTGQEVTYSGSASIDTGTWAILNDATGDYIRYTIGYENFGSPTDMAFRWTMTCANDVNEGGVDFGNQIPEPSTLIFLGSGLLLLGGYLRKKRS